MSEEKIAKGQIVEQIAEKTGLTKKQAAQAFDQALDTVITALQSGKSVGLPSLGTFRIKATAARTGVRPGTNEKISIPEGRKVSYSAASTLKNQL